MVLRKGLRRNNAIAWLAIEPVTGRRFAKTISGGNYDYMSGSQSGYRMTVSMQIVDDYLMQIVVGTLREKRFGCHVSNFSAQCFMEDTNPTFAGAAKLLDSTLEEVSKALSPSNLGIESGIKVITEEEARSQNIHIQEPEQWNAAEINMPRSSAVAGNNLASENPTSVRKGWSSGKKIGIGMGVAVATIFAVIIIASTIPTSLSAEQVASLRNFDSSNYQVLSYCWVEYTDGVASGSRGIRPDDVNRCLETMASIYHICQSEPDVALEYVPSCKDSRLESAAQSWQHEIDVAKNRDNTNNPISSQTGQGGTYPMSSSNEMPSSSPNTSDIQNTAIQTRLSIDNFEVASGDSYKMAFSLKEGATNVTTNGTASIAIKDIYGTIIFSKEVQVTSTQFRMYSWQSNNVQTLAYELDVPKGDIKQGSGNGIAELTFIPLNGSSLSSTFRNFIIPQNENIAKITQFWINKVGSNYQVQFGLLNVNNQEVSTEGSALLSITDSYGDILYMNTVQVHKADFNTVTALDGSQFFGHAWQIPITELKDGLESGSAKLNFVSNVGKSFTETTTIEIPQMSVQEAIGTYQQIFLKSATTEDQTVSGTYHNVYGNADESIKITLVRAGQYHFLKDSAGSPYEAVKRFRADFLVTNTENRPVH